MNDAEKKPAPREAIPGPSYTVYDIDVLLGGDPETGRARHRDPKKTG